MRGTSIFLQLLGSHWIFLRAPLRQVDGASPTSCLGVACALYACCLGAGPDAGSCWVALSLAREGCKSLAESGAPLNLTNPKQPTIPPKPVPFVERELRTLATSVMVALVLPAERPVGIGERRKATIMSRASKIIRNVPLLILMASSAAAAAEPSPAPVGKVTAKPAAASTETPPAPAAPAGSSAEAPESSDATQSGGVAAPRPTCPAETETKETLELHGVEEQGLSATAFAQGVGSFLAQRAEQEVSAFATVELFSRICESDTKAILPKTCELLEEQDEGANPVGLGLLKRTVEEDLVNLPQQLLETAFDRVEEARKPEHGANSRTLARLEVTAKTLCAIDVGVSFLQAMRAGRTLGDLFTVSDDGTPEVEGLKAYSTLSTRAECQGTWASVTRNVPDRQQFSALNVAIDKVRHASSLEEARARRKLATELAADLLEGMLAESPRAYLGELTVLATAVLNHDWVTLVSTVTTSKHLAPVLLFEEPKAETVQEASPSGVATPEAKGMAVSSNAEVEAGGKKDGRLSLALSLAADIAAAESSGEVQGVLNRVSQPIGSWRRKFQDTLTFSLQGYAGAKYAREEVRGSAPAGTALAPILAVGLDLSFTVGSWGRLGVFAQAIDVGNVASVHLADEEDPNLTQVEAEPDISWPQLFSPGAYVVWAPFKAPFVLGAGGDWVPALRETSDGPRSVWHLGAFVAVDVTILELAHR